MAIRLTDIYPNRTGPTNSDYPHGSIVNESEPGAGDGTPLEQQWGNDLVGFLQALVESAGISPDNNPDTATDSQYLDALLTVTRGETTVDVGGSSDVTLSTYDSRIAIIRLTGSLTADIDVVAPDTARIYYVIDETTGGYTVTFRTANGTGVALYAGSQFVRSDGTDMVVAQPRVGTAQTDLARWSDMQVASISDLVALSDPSSQITVHVRGFYSAGDRGGGPFFWDSGADKANHDGGMVIDPDHSVTPGNSGWWSSENTGSGCWVRQLDHNLNVKMFGTKENGTDDDAPAIQAAIDAATRGATVEFIATGASSFYTASVLTVDKPMVLRGGMSKFLCDTAWISVTSNAANSIVDGFYVEGSRTSSASNIGYDCAADYAVLSNCEIYNFYLQVRYTSGVWARTHKIRARNAVNTVLEIENTIGNVVEDFRYDTDTGTYAEPETGLRTSSNGCNYSDMDLIAAGNSLYMYTSGEDCTWNFFNSCSFDTGTRGIWITVTDSTYSIRGNMFDHCWIASHSEEGILLDGADEIDGASFKGCHVVNNGKNGMTISGTSDNIEVKGCTFAGNSQASASTHNHIEMDTIGYVNISGNDFTHWGGHTNQTNAAVYQTATGGDGGILLAENRADDNNDTGFLGSSGNGTTEFGRNYGKFDLARTRQNLMMTKKDSGTSDSDGYVTFEHGFWTTPSRAMIEMDPDSGNQISVTSFDSTTITAKVTDLADGSPVANGGAWLVTVFMSDTEDV